MLDLWLLSANINNWMWVILIIFARFYGVLFVFPLFNNNYLSRFLKVCLALLLSFIVYPYFNHIEFQQNSIIINFMFIIKDFIYGIIISYLLSFPFWLIESLGNIIDLQRGEQLGSAINPLTSSRSSSIGKLLSQTFIVYYVVNQGLLFFFDIVMRSFKIAPIDKLLPMIRNYHEYIAIFNSYFYWMVILALPVISIMFFFEFVLGMISSFIPQLNVTILAMPLKSAIAIFLLTIYTGFLNHEVFIRFITKASSFF